MWSNVPYSRRTIKQGLCSYLPQLFHFWAVKHLQHFSLTPAVQVDLQWKQVWGKMFTCSTQGWPRSSHRPLSETRLETVFKRNWESHQHPFQDKQVFGIRKDHIGKSGGEENVSLITVDSFVQRWILQLVGSMFVCDFLKNWNVCLCFVSIYAPHLIWRILWVEAGKGKDKNSPWSHLSRWGFSFNHSLVGNNLRQCYSPLFI